MSGTYVVRAGDPVLRSQALATLLDELVAGEDRTLVVEEHTVPGRATSSEDGGGAADERSEVVAAILNAVQSPPLVTTRRVVVVHDPEHLTADEAAPLVAYLATPLETTTLVMVGAGGRLPRPLGDALRTATTVGPRSEHTEDVLDDALGSAGLRLEPAAARAVAEHLGEDAGRIGALVEVLGAAHGPGVTLALDDVTPYLGEAGPVPAYLLTNRIEEGDAAGAQDRRLPARHRPEDGERREAGDEPRTEPEPAQQRPDEREGEGHVGAADREEVAEAGRPEFTDLPGIDAAGVAQQEAGEQGPLTGGEHLGAAQHERPCGVRGSGEKASGC